MRRVSLFALCLLSLTSCSALKKATGHGGAGGQGWSESAATAPSYAIGETVNVKAPPCNVGGYFKIKVDPGKPFHITTKASQAGSSCGYVEVETASGSSVTSVDVCAESGPKTVDAQGQEGSTLVQVSEKYGCAGITITMAIEDGPAPANTGAGVAPTDDGPQPEN